MMISHQLVIYVLSMRMVKCYQLQLCKNFTTSDGIFNISLMKMNINMMMMSGPILLVKPIGFTKTFIKYVNFTLQEMTPEQLKQNPITVHPNQKLDTEKGESNTDEQESIISNKEEEESPTFSEMSKQDSESDIDVDDSQDQENSQTPETLQIHNVYNTAMHDKDDSIHDEYDTSEDENITEIETYEHYGEKIHETESQNLQKHLKFLLYSTKSNTQMQTQTLGINPKKCDYHQTFTSQPSDHDTSQETYFMPINQTNKKLFISCNNL